MAKKLLLADDSVTIQKVVGISFANEDVEILSVDNGDDALSRARETLPDIVLADVVMPGKNGYEVCEALKADSRLAHVPVMLLTGTFEAFDEDRAARVGADGHITKPFEAQSLVDQVNQLLARASRTPAAGAPPAHAEVEPAVSAEPSPDLDAAESAPSAGDGAFDFFDEDLPAAAPARPAAPGAGDVSGPRPSPESSFRGPAGATTPEENEIAEVAAPDTTAFELDAGESAFDFAPMVDEPAPARPGEDPTVVTPEVPAREAEETGDRTVAIGVEMSGAEDDEETWPEDDDLDAAFGEEELGSLDVDAPDGDEAGDLEALDLDAGTSRSLAASGPAPDASDGPEITEPAEGRELLEEMEPSQDARQTLLDPDAEDAFAVSSSDLGDPLAASGGGEPTTDSSPASAPPWAGEAAEEPRQPRVETLGESGAAGAISQPGPARPAQDPQDLVTPARDARPDLSPEMRERVHDSLEKIAWEAFADLPDTVVRHAVAKVEEIAWEVIPQMAEALIREEIRRLKGEEE